MKRPRPHSSATEPPAELRIIGGSQRGRKLLYSGDPRTRPMKERVREAVFNLFRDDVRGTYAIDLFAGTGALGLEAVSRGSVGALLIERHFPTAKLIEQNAAALGMADVARVFPGSAFLWAHAPDAPLTHPWLIFCAPPYAFYTDQTAALGTLWEQLRRHAPPGSMWMVETPATPEEPLASFPGDWDVRQYGPAVIHILRT